MSIISGLETYFTSFSGTAGNPVMADFLGSLPTRFSITSLAGPRTVATFLDDSRICEYPFAFQSLNYTFSDAQRMDALGFLEVLSEWLDDQSDADNLPTLDAGETAQKIEALGHGYLFQAGQSDTGVYQIQCKLTYKKA